MGTKLRGRPRVPSLRSSCSCSSSSRGLVVSAAPRPVRLHHCPQRLSHCARTLRKARSPEARRPLGPARHGVVRQGAWARGPRRPHVLVSAGERPGQLPETPNSLGAPALSGEGRGTSLTAELRPRLAARATPPPTNAGSPPDFPERKGRGAGGRTGNGVTYAATQGPHVEREHARSIRGRTAGPSARMLHHLMNRCHPTRAVKDAFKTCGDREGGETVLEE